VPRTHELLSMVDELADWLHGWEREAAAGNPLVWIRQGNLLAGCMLDVAQKLATKLRRYELPTRDGIDQMFGLEGGAR